MTSARKIAANRINAQKSCGPRSKVGKGRVSSNALRHGLAALKHLDAMRPRDIDLMARAMCGDDIDPLLFERAQVIAENELLLRCVRAERIAVIERLRDVAALPLAIRDDSMARAKARVLEMDRAAAELERMQARFDALTAEERTKLYEEYYRELDELDSKPPPIAERDEVDAMRESMPDLKRLARYERRAWSRRKRAMRNFMDIKTKRFKFRILSIADIGVRALFCP
jgi:hypothetical protein